MTRRFYVTIKLDRRCEQTLEKERARIKAQYNLDVTLDELVQGLIEQHRAKLRTMSETEKTPVMVEWFWRLRPDEEE